MKRSPRLAACHSLAAVGAGSVRSREDAERARNAGARFLVTPGLVDGAAAAGLPLWRHLGGDAACTLPLPEIQIFGGGAHAAGRLDIQDFLVVCPGAATFAQALDWTAEVYRAAGRLLAERGLLKGVADEGGYWPELADNEAALAMLTRVQHH